MLIHLIPGDLVTILLGITASQNEQTRQALIQTLRLDRPLVRPVRVLAGRRARGDLGLPRHRPVGGRRAGAQLPGDAPARADGHGHRAGRGHPDGVLAATQAGRALDGATRVFSLLFISAPAFFIGTIVIIAGARYAPWLPTLGHVPFGESPARSLGAMLPAAASSAWPSAIVARFTRSSMLDVLGQDYVRTARQGRGRPPSSTSTPSERADPGGGHGRHPVRLLIGGVIIEEVFALPGMGRLVVNAIYQRDYDDPGSRARADLGGRAGQPHPRSPVPRDRPADRLRMTAMRVPRAPGPRLAPGRGAHRRRPGRGGAGRAMARATGPCDLPGRGDPARTGASCWGPTRSGATS